MASSQKLPQQVSVPSFNQNVESHLQRRTTSSSSGVTSASSISTSRYTSATPRNDQNHKKQHKTTRRPQLVDEDMMDEATAIKSAKSRKGQTSITHLMNFALPPRPTQQSYHHHNLYTRSVKRNPTWGIGSGYHAVDKARYIHANYRFVVDPRGDYTAQAVDADVHLSWDSVLQILVSAKSQQANCPICLSHPVAPRMARCGHIFCLPCLIRYMHSDDADSVPEKKARSKKCPICYDSIYISETRQARWFEGQEGTAPQEGHDIVLRLIRRDAGSSFALPKDSMEQMVPGTIPWYCEPDVTDYARVMKGSEEYMQKYYDEEIDALVQQEKEDELMFGEDTIWTRKAMASIREAKEKVKGIGSITHEETKPPRQLPTTSTTPQSNSNSATSTYFFYQALLHYYLSSLDVRILKAAYGEYSSFPTALLPRIEHVSTGHIVDDELRRRSKYLSHLPSGCEVSFIECNWTDVIPPETLSKFKPELDRRRKRNEEKELREEKERIRAERAEEDERWSAARRKRYSGEISEDGFTSASIPLEASFSASLGATSPVGSWLNTRANGGNVYDSLSAASPSTSPAASRTVWGTAMVPPVSPNVLPVAEPHDDGWLQNWEDDILIEHQLASVHLGNGESSSANANGTSVESPSTHGGGKKKKKKITLMSTNARRAA